MQKTDSLLFSDEELGKKAPEAKPENEKKVEDKDPEPKNEPEVKEHDSKTEDPKTEEAPKAPEDGKDLKPEEKAPEAKDVKPEEVKPEMHDVPADKNEKTPQEGVEEVAKKEAAEEKSFDDLYFDTTPEEIDFDSLYFSAEELHDYSTLFFDIEAEKKAEEEKNKEEKKPEEPKKDPEEPAPADDKDASKKEELHDEGKPLSGAPEGPKPAKKSLKEIIEDYEKTKKPYTDEAVASEAGVPVEEVAKMKKELGLMSEEKKDAPAPAPSPAPEVKPEETKKDECPINKEEALKALADIKKKESLGKELNVAEKFFCDSMKKFFSIEEVTEALRKAAPITPGEIKKNKMELIHELNAANNKKHLNTLVKNK